MFGLPIVDGDAAVNHERTFRVEEKIVSATRDSFIIKDHEGIQRYKVDGLFSITERKVMKDANGRVLLKLKEARFKIRDKITIFNSGDQPVLTLRKASAIQIGAKRVNGFLGDRMTGAPIIVITGNGSNTKFHIKANDREVAEIRRRKFSLKNMLTDQDTYDVTVRVGSAALICFVTVALDEIYED